MAYTRMWSWNWSITKMSLIIFVLKFILPLIKPVVRIFANLFLGETIGSFAVNSVYSIINLVL